MPIRRHVMSLFSTKDESLISLKKIQNEKKKKKSNDSKKTKAKTKKQQVTPSTTSLDDDPPPSSSQQQHHGVSLKALKRLEQATKRMKPSAKSGVQHESKLFLGAINSKFHTDEVTGMSLCESYVVTACRDRELRVFKVDAKKTATMVAHHIVRSGVFDVVCLGVAEQNMTVAFMTYGPYATVEVHTARISLRSKDPSMDVLDKKIKIFAPKIDFDPLILTGTHTRLVAASIKPRIAVFDAEDGRLQSSGTIDTGSIVNNDVALSSDGTRLCVATFSPDVPVYSLPEGKKLTSLSGHRKRVTGVAISPDGTQVATASDDLTLRIWNIDVRHHLQEDPRCIARVGLPCSMGLTHLSWIHPHAIAGVGGQDVYIFDASSGSVMHSILQAHAGKIACLEPTQSPSSSCAFATGGEDGTVKLWRHDGS